MDRLASRQHQTLARKEQTMDKLKRLIYKGTEYVPVVIMREALIAIAPLPDGCCTRVLFAQQGGEPNVVTEANPAINQIARFAGDHGVESNGLSKVPPTKSPDWELAVDEPYLVPGLSHQYIPGTTAGTQYFMLAETTHGAVARRGPEMKHTTARIRVAPKPGTHKALAINKGYSVTDSGLPWQTIDPEHLAHSGKNASQMRALVARGTKVLIEHENGIWHE